MKKRTEQSVRMNTRQTKAFGKSGREEESSSAPSGLKGSKNKQQNQKPLNDFDEL